MAIGDVTFYANSIHLYGIDYTAEPAMITQNFTCSGGETSGELYDLLDNKRSSVLTVDTDGESTNFSVDYDITLSLDYNFYIIDNHNLYTAGAAVEFNDNGSPVLPTSYYGGSLGSALSVQTLDGNHIIKPADGILLVGLTSGSDQNIRFDFNYDSGTYTADVTMGEIIVGTSRTISIAPDINIIKDYKKQKGLYVYESLGGQKYSHQNIAYGRTAWQLSWQAISAADKLLMELVWRATEGGRHPFYIDLGEAATPQLYYVRFMQDSLRFIQLTSGLYSVTLQIESEIGALGI